MTAPINQIPDHSGDPTAKEPHGRRQAEKIGCDVTV